MAATPQTALIQDPANAARGGRALTVRRLFTQPGVDAFDTVE